MPLRTRLAHALVLLLLFPLAAKAQETAPDRPAGETAVAPAPEPAPQAAETLDPEARAQLREEIRKEVRQELEAELGEAMAAQREEIRAEVRAAVAASMAAEEWQPERWEVEEAPRLELFEIDGYFRVRGDIFHNFDLNAGTDASGAPLYPRPAFDPFGSDTLGGGNQRLRLDPVLNVSEDIRVMGTVDVLDNLVWGSTPAPGRLGTPLLAFSESAVEPISGVNAAFDSISVKRVWAEVLTPVGMLRFGRMGVHWGLGLLANDGNCLDCDYGDTVDRVMFVTKVADFLVAPSLDLPSSGLYGKPYDVFQGQAVDLEQRDDVQQYTLVVKREDPESEIEQRLLEGQWVVNYGLFNALRVQNVDSLPGDPNAFVQRDAWAYIPDAWVRFMAPRLRIELEAVAVLGRIGNARLDASTTSDDHVDLRQFGAVLQADYKFDRDRLTLGGEVGFASGDRARGMGLWGTDAAPSEGVVNARQYNLDPAAGDLDHSIDNFAFDPDYHVDLILWREIFGRVTDAIYVKPKLSYELTRSFGFDVSAIYSRSIFLESLPGDANDLGIELDGALRYRASDGFIAQLQYGILFPMDGLRLATGDENDPEIAQTVQGTLAIAF